MAIKSPESRGFLRQGPTGRTVIRCSCGAELGKLADDERLAKPGQATQTRTTRCGGCGKTRTIGVTVG